VTQPDIKALEAKLEQNRKNYPHAQIDPDIALAAELYLQSLKAGMLTVQELEKMKDEIAQEVCSCTKSDCELREGAYACIDKVIGRVKNVAI
jgi:hypothetical protein